jgi:hypothetical protein
MRVLYAGLGKAAEDRLPERGRPRALLAIPLALLALTVFATPASAAKATVNSVGLPTTGTIGATFNIPKGVAVNETGAGGVPAGTFYVVDNFNFRIQQFDPTAAFVRTWGWGVKDGDSEYQVCSAAADCKRGIAGNGAGQLNRPQGAAVDQARGFVYVTDQNSRRINIFSAKGVFIGAFGWGAQTGANAFQYCTSVTGCSNPNTTAATGGQAGKFGAPTPNPSLGYPAVDAAGNVYVADMTNRRVDVFAPTVSAGTVTGVAFVRAFGFDVSTAVGTGFEVCTGADCKQGTGGSGVGQFAAIGSPSQIAIDSTGKIYVLDPGNKRVQEFNSTPAPVNATFGAAALTAAFGAGATLQNLAVDREADHVYVSGLRPGAGNRVAVAELNASGAAVDVHGLDLNATSANGLAVAPASLGGNIYVSTESDGHRILILNEPPTMDPVTTFTGTTATFTGDVVSNNFEVEYHFEYSRDGENWTSVPGTDVTVGPEPGTIPVEQQVQGLTGSQPYRVRLVQNRPSAGGVAISSEVTFTTDPAAPAIGATAASSITDVSAVLSANLNPQNEVTTYHFEYGLSDCSLNPCSSLPSKELEAGAVGVSVSQSVGGLQPGTVYHFRLVASNASGEAKGPNRTFETLPAGATLPENRAYELVSPVDPNGVFLAALNENFNNFPTPMASLDGNSVIFHSDATLPGTEGNGTINGYRSQRSSSGWATSAFGPTGVEAAAPSVGGTSPDHVYTFWNSGVNGGTLQTAPGGNDLLRNPDGTYEQIGIGSLGEDPQAIGQLITPGGSHVIFSTKPGESIQLEPDAPPSGTAAIYDRGANGPTRVVSLLPGVPDDITPTANADYMGSSEDGTAVAFKVEDTLYVRLDNSETLVVVGPGSVFAGVSRNGDRVFYLLGGDLFEFDTSTEATTPIGSGGESTAVNISADGSHVYFSSPVQLDGSEGQAGAPNLYVWDGSTVEFIAVLDPQDFIGFGDQPGKEELVNLGRWTTAVGPSHTALEGPANDPSRTTPDGSVLVFQSHGVVGYPYDNEGFSKIYRYDSEDETLVCISCSSLVSGGSSEDELQSTLLTVLGAPTNAQTRVQNVTDDGSTVFFQTRDPMVPEDTDGLNDVYRWRNGQVALISSGRSTSDDYLFAMTPDGHDVFFKTSDKLVPEDESGGSGSIYDARVGGGFPSAQSGVGVCLEASCQTPAAAPPILPNAGSATFHGPADPKRRHKKKRCKAKHGKAQQDKAKQCRKKQGKRTNRERGGAK